MKPKLRIVYEYFYGKRGVLKPGDRFRVRGGPVFRTESGALIPMAERGLMVFKRLCQRGADKWIEAASVRGSSHVILWVGKSRRSSTVDNLIRRPYRIVAKARPDPNGCKRISKRSGRKRFQRGLKVFAPQAE